jgi:hypothetical protein
LPKAAELCNFTITFLSLLLYVALIIVSTTHEQILRIKPVKLPLLDVDIPIVEFYWFMPGFLFFMHLYILVQHYLFSQPAFRFKEALALNPLIDIYRAIVWFVLYVICRIFRRPINNGHQHRTLRQSLASWRYNLSDTSHWRGSFSEIASPLLLASVGIFGETLFFSFFVSTLPDSQEEQWIVKAGAFFHQKTKIWKKRKVIQLTLSLKTGFG